MRLWAWLGIRRGSVRRRGIVDGLKRENRQVLVMVLVRKTVVMQATRSVVVQEPEQAKTWKA